MAIINLNRNNNPSPENDSQPVKEEITPVANQSTSPQEVKSQTTSNGVQVSETSDGIREITSSSGLDSLPNLDPNQLQSSIPAPSTPDISSNLDEKLDNLNRNQPSIDDLINKVKSNGQVVLDEPVATETVTKTPQIETNEEKDIVQVAQQDQVAEQLPAPELQQKVNSLTDLIKEAIAQNASDLHLTVGYRAIVRVDGKLKSLNTALLTPETMTDFVRELTKYRSNLRIEELKELDLGYTFMNRRLRVNIFKQMGNFSVVARIIPEKIQNIDELGLPQLLKEFAKIKSGLVLVTGPTGSGKSTTLASVLNFINLTQSRHIVTLEDPIEFVFPKGTGLVDQREHGSDFDSWENALRYTLRQDPDIVYVGEMRDYETIASTITVSETGHLVFATLHTNSAAQTIDRIIDVFPDVQQSQVRTQLANSLTAVISQRLVPVTGGGRKAVMEVMIATSAIRNLIREGNTHQIDNVIQTSQDYGMITLEKALVEMIKKGEITVETAKGISNKPEEINTLLNQ